MDIRLMDLIEQATNTRHNLLPYDGEVYYYGQILTAKQADAYFQWLDKEIAWAHDRVKIFGKTITTSRKVAWYGNDAFRYTYAHVTKTALPWTDTLLQIKQIVEQESGATYNSCLLNLYHNGQEGMSWHSDNEKALKKDAPIASISLGAQRRFLFQHKKTKQRITQQLEHGSLLVMQGVTQLYWLHQLPLVKTNPQARINLTFRSIADTSDRV